MVKHKNEHYFYSQFIPLALTVVIFIVFSLFLHGFIGVLNTFTSTDIKLTLRLTDVMIGLTIYLKTSVDFAIYIGNLMKKFPGWKNRIPIEIGTALGNALGTIIVLTIWNFFRDVEIVLIIMIFIASLVLIKLSEDGFEHAFASNRVHPLLVKISTIIYRVIHRINNFFAPVVGKVIPTISFSDEKVQNDIRALFVFSFTVPFILGLDDFAGYVPLFNIVNVFGFAVGVFAGHMILNALLFLAPTKTIKAVSNPYIALAGGYVFILLALIGFNEIAHLLHLY